jgi:hypothetical protein
MEGEGISNVAQLSAIHSPRNNVDLFAAGLLTYLPVPISVLCPQTSPYLITDIQIHLYQQPYHNIITQNANSRITISSLKLTTAVSQYHHSKCQQPYHSIITQNDNSRITVSSLKLTTAVSQYHHSN